MTQTLILGIGNILLQDEGVGVRIVEHLQRHYHFPDTVQLLDGGTMGLDLLHCLEGIDRLLVIDAVDARQPPGTFIRLVNDEIPTFLGRGISPHQLGLSDILSVAQLCNILPPQIVLLGVQPASVDTGLELSPAIAAQVDMLVEAVLHELRSWQICISSAHHVI
jgi:hydrogenase maturation protease